MPSIRSQLMVGIRKGMLPYNTFAPITPEFGGNHLAQICFEKGYETMCVCFLLAGNYMMIIGQLDSCGHLPVIHAMKLHDLSSDTALQTMWPFEVRDARLHTK